jgi:uncharacterized protein (DUF1330 family)
MKGYWLIIGTQVSDQGAQAEYARLWQPIAEKYQARIKPVPNPGFLREARDAHRVVIVEFPSYDLAQACYEDPAYEEARAFALRASSRELLVFEGNLP